MHVKSIPQYYHFNSSPTRKFRSSINLGSEDTFSDFSEFRLQYLQRLRRNMHQALPCMHIAQTNTERVIIPSCILLDYKKMVKDTIKQ